MDKEYVVYIFNGILFSYKKEAKKIEKKIKLHRKTIKGLSNKVTYEQMHEWREEVSDGGKAEKNITEGTINTKALGSAFLAYPRNTLAAVE